MRQKQPSPVQLQNPMSVIYHKILDKMEVLDQLNADYKVKQEEHFLKTFMTVLEKLGNDLILAQEAYRNVDLQARKDNYCLLLATELNFFKDQAYSLRELLTAKEKQIGEIKTEKETLESEMKFMRQGFESKVKECMRLRSEVQELKKQIKFLSDPTKNSIFKFTNPETSRDSQLKESHKKKSSSFANYLQQGSLELKPIENRFLMTNDHNRRKNISQTLEVNGGRSSAHERADFDFQRSRKQDASTHSSFRKKLISQHLNRTALQSYEPILEP